MPTIQTIQIRLGQKTSEKLKKWAVNQSNLNDSVKRVLDHFIDVYGIEDIDTLEVKLKMAGYLVSAQGGQPEPRKAEKNVFHQPPEPKPEQKKKIIDRGKIDI